MVYDSRENCNALIETSINTLICGCECTTIPQGIKRISEGAFSGHILLTAIAIPDGVTSIGDNAFAYCESLNAITIPDSVKHIGNRAFATCSSLTAITIPSSVKSIGYYAFEGCSSLTDITFNGTKEQWQQFDLNESGCISNIPAKVVHCADGDVEIIKTLTL